MTGFARVEDTSAMGNLSWELRSVNHRYLEVNFRLPEEVRRLEPQLRKSIQTKLSRGKVDCVFRYQLAETATAALELNEPLLDSLIRQINYVNDKLREQAPAKAIDLLAWPGLVQTAQADMEQFHTVCFDLFKNALDQLTDMRATEGQRIEKVIQEKCKEIGFIVKKIRSQHPNVFNCNKRQAATAD